jgi:hypothetical protein
MGGDSDDDKKIQDQQIESTSKMVASSLNPKIYSDVVVPEFITKSKKPSANDELLIALENKSKSDIRINQIATVLYSNIGYFNEHASSFLEKVYWNLAKGETLASEISEAKKMIGHLMFAKELKYSKDVKAVIKFTGKKRSFSSRKSKAGMKSLSKDTLEEIVKYLETKKDGSGNISMDNETFKKEFIIMNYK